MFPPTGIVNRALRVVVRVFEREMGSVIAHKHVCVSERMRKWLIKEYGVEESEVFVFYDKPPKLFERVTVSEKHAVFGKYCFEDAKRHLNVHISTAVRHSVREEATVREGTTSPSTLLTKTVHGKPALRDDCDRPFIIVSSTSWTADEDFSILHNALIKLDRRVKDDHTFPPVLVIVTGKGPLKAHYERLFKDIVLVKVFIQTIWLDVEDYPKLLGSSDLGVCLHTSTSGVDLPMKVVDMFGCGLPVAAVRYETIDELVKDGVNGVVFDDCCMLAEQLESLVKNRKVLDKLRRGVGEGVRWEQNWKNVMTGPKGVIGELLLRENEGIPQWRLTVMFSLFISSWYFAYQSIVLGASAA